MQSMNSALTALAILLSFGALTPAAEPISLMKPAEAWSFDNGREFPGATGSLSVKDGTLNLVGDFTGGGGYVQAGRKLNDLAIRELSLQLRSPDTDRLTLRLGDASGQTHQIVLRIDTAAGYQRISLPLQRFFEQRGKAGAVTSVLKYESWGGAKDGRWHGPARGLYLLLSNRGTNAVRTISFRDITIIPEPQAVAGAEQRTSIPLDDIVEGVHDWRFTNGAEFKGATGSLNVVNDVPETGEAYLKLAGDFTGGGAYVAAIRDLDGIAARDTTAFRMRLRSENARSLSVQLVDASGQTHQRKALPVKHDGQWHEMVLIPTDIAGGEHWGGANDGKWHGPARRLVISITTRSDPEKKQPVLLIDDVKAEVLLPVFAQPAAFRADFETGKLTDDWKTTGDVTIHVRKDQRRLLLSRPLDNVQQPCGVTGPAFDATPGQWEIRLTRAADLHSPDNSYNAAVRLECLNSAGKVIERIGVDELCGKQKPESVRRLIELPDGTAQARFSIELNKTYGRFEVDDLSAAYLAPAPQRDDRVERMLFATNRLGNLLYPDDPREVTVTVQARKPLRESERVLSCVVRDYWGAEQIEPKKIALGPAQRKQHRFVYEAKLSLDDAPLEIGRYYEVHCSAGASADKISPAGTDAAPLFSNYTSLAILPEAITRQYKPEEIPFTSRNWDNRIEQFVRLTDRLGVRICGLWGGWKAIPPYRPEAPQLKLVEEFGMGWLTTTPAKFIERGKYDYDEQALRQGVRNLIEKYGHVRPLIINLGNEPHGTGEVVRKNVEAYRVLYDEIKKVDPTIKVVATSVEPNEEYFKLGYGTYCDAYDFHIYEDSSKVRRTMREYRELARRYDVEKPIWSTELGLNSQGLPRHRVAVELYRKFATFFAAGGENVSWFGLLYPDPEGKSFGSSGDAHNVFDCRFNRYCPRLDAIAYYHAVNSIAIKKFVAEKQYPSGIRAFLFRDRDGRSLQILWKDNGRADILLPLPDIAHADVIRIDGSTRRLHANGQPLPLTVSGDPLLVLYQGDVSLPADLKPSPVTFGELPMEISTSSATTLTVRTSGDDSDINLIAPPFWRVERSAGDPRNRSAIDFTLTPPKQTAVREVDLTVAIKAPAGHRTGELHHRIPVAE